MTVKELIEALSQKDPKQIVVLAAQDSGYHEVGQVTEVLLALSSQEDDGWNGPHEDADYCDNDSSTRSSCIYLHPEGHA